MANAYLEDCLSRKVIFFTGKGGVGKSTLAWATALACRQKGPRVTVVSWNPLEPYAHASADETPGERGGVKFLPLETLAAFREYALQKFKFETIYHVVFDNHVLKTFIRAAPGLAETVIAGKIWDLYDKRDQDLLIVDLPSSGHAVTFFQSPLGVQKIFAVGFVHKEADKICQLFQSRESRIDLVTLPEELPLVEGAQLKKKLEAIHPFHFGFLHVNQCTPDFPLPPPPDLSALSEDARACVQQHLERRRQEEEALACVPGFAMTSHRIPRFPEASLQETLQRVKESLEKA